MDESHFIEHYSHLIPVMFENETGMSIEEFEMEHNFHKD